MLILFTSNEDQLRKQIEWSQSEIWRIFFSFAASWILLRTLPTTCFRKHAVCSSMPYDLVIFAHYSCLLTCICLSSNRILARWPVYGTFRFLKLKKQISVQVYSGEWSTLHLFKNWSLAWSSRKTIQGMPSCNVCMCNRVYRFYFRSNFMNIRRDDESAPPLLPPVLYIAYISFTSWVTGNQC